MLAYSKIWLYDELLASTLPDDPWVGDGAVALFPERAARAATRRTWTRHPLKREIIATHVHQQHGQPRRQHVRASR